MRLSSRRVSAAAPRRRRRSRPRSFPGSEPRIRNSFGPSASSRRWSSRSAPRSRITRGPSCCSSRRQGRGDGLGRFPAALPRDFRYAVELRDRSLLTEEYRAALAEAGAAHVYNYATAMPMPQVQAAAVPLQTTASFTVIRLLLAPGTRYNDRREEFEPFDRIVAPDLEMRRQVVSLARQASSLGRDVFVLVNNKAEGCSPLTIRALAEMLASESA